MDDLQALDADPAWRRAVWALRVGYGALAVALVGLVVLVAGSTPWVMAVGVVAWLLCAVTLGTGFVAARNRLGGPGPGFLAMRAKLLRDTVHTRPAA